MFLHPGIVSVVKYVLNQTESVKKEKLSLDCLGYDFLETMDF